MLNLLSLNEVRRIAGDVASKESPALEVIAATISQGGSAYAELVIALHDCPEDPCRVVIGTDRRREEPELRHAIGLRMRQFLRNHRA